MKTVMNVNSKLATKNIADEIFSNEVIYNLADIPQKFNEENFYVEMSRKGNGKRDRASKKK
ncbi:MAG: hypothetical protein RLZZ535_2992 [Cyanobacteriota bacterium]|jgi:hypothetical protein